MATGITVGGVFTAIPASAGGVGDFLSPAFGTSCANHNVGSSGVGNTTADTGTLNGNLAGLPLGSPLNQCGGADLEPSMLHNEAATFLNGNLIRNEVVMLDD